MFPRIARWFQPTLNFWASATPPSAPTGEDQLLQPNCDLHRWVSRLPGKRLVLEAWTRSLTLDYQTEGTLSGELGQYFQRLGWGRVQIRLQGETRERHLVVTRDNFEVKGFFDVFQNRRNPIALHGALVWADSVLIQNFSTLQPETLILVFRHESSQDSKISSPVELVGSGVQIQLLSILISLRIIPQQVTSFLNLDAESQVRVAWASVQAVYDPEENRMDWGFSLDLESLQFCGGRLGIRSPTLHLVVYGGLSGELITAEVIRSPIQVLLANGAQVDGWMEISFDTNTVRLTLSTPEAGLGGEALSELINPWWQKFNSTIQIDPTNGVTIDFEPYGTYEQCQRLNAHIQMRVEGVEMKFNAEIQSSLSRVEAVWIENLEIRLEQLLPSVVSSQIPAVVGRQLLKELRLWIHGEQGYSGTLDLQEMTVGSGCISLRLNVGMERNGAQVKAKIEALTYLVLKTSDQTTSLINLHQVERSSRFKGDCFQMQFPDFVCFFPLQVRGILKRMTQRIIDDPVTSRNAKKWISVYNIELVIDIETGDLELSAGWCYDGDDEPAKSRCQYEYRHIPQGAEAQHWIQIQEWNAHLRRLLNLDDFRVEEGARVARLEIA